MLNRYEPGFFAEKQKSADVTITDMCEYLSTRTYKERKLLISQLCHGLIAVSFLIGIGCAERSWKACLLGLFAHTLQACINVESDGVAKILALAINAGCLESLAQQAWSESMSGSGIMNMLDMASYGAGLLATGVAIYEGAKPKKKRL